MSIRIRIVISMAVLFFAGSVYAQSCDTRDDGSLRPQAQKDQMTACGGVTPNLPIQPQVASGSLTTIFATDNQFAGNTFDLEVIGSQALTIESFDINIDNGGVGPHTIAIYYKLGTSVGFENMSGAWTLMGTDASVVSAGTNNPTPVAVGGLTMNPGQVYGIYVDLQTYPSASMLYSNGGPTVFSNAELQLTTNTGQGDPAFVGSIFFPRQWNGTVYYSFSEATSFRVIKDFADDNPAEVEVTLNCFTGLPITQSQTISEAQDVNFIVESFADGELDCNVTESDVTGYMASYDNGVGLSGENCEYTDVVFGQVNTCTIINTPEPVEVSVYKDWIIEGEGGDSIDPYYRLVLACRGEIVGGSTHGPSGIWRKELYSGGFLGTSDAEFNADVVPDWDGGTACWVLETVYDSAVEVNNGCGSNPFPGMNVELAGGDSCTVVNTVFFEGIPTLSQYGMAILALLMLGVGFVGFRRFV
ncbi:MAG TPA: IPTL-CTERM sorting domain-containing protein [Xanthomonadales bacterium]|nr:IPTL-CTERM sorting domain-containing protein [Xanthomonadales bacterium]